MSGVQYTCMIKLFSRESGGDAMEREAERAKDQGELRGLIAEARQGEGLRGFDQRELAYLLLDNLGVKNPDDAKKMEQVLVQAGSSLQEFQQLERRGDIAGARVALQRGRFQDALHVVRRYSGADRELGVTEQEVLAGARAEYLAIVQGDLAKARERMQEAQTSGKTDRYTASTPARMIRYRIEETQENKRDFHITYEELGTTKDEIKQMIATGKEAR